MPVKVIVGTFWGDEGKGKISHYASRNANIVIRATGGSNAGHTVVANNTKFALHLLPSSIIREDVKSIIGPGVVIDLEILKEEIECLKKLGINPNLYISDKASIVLPLHKELDTYIEKQKSVKVGTTNRGIGPAYADKCYRLSLRMIDLLDLKTSLNRSFKDSLLLEDLLIDEPRCTLVTEIRDILYENANYFKDYICNTQELINNALENNETIIIEGAQATYLDLDHGDYPYVTSSNPIASGACTGAGIGPMYVTDVYGVMKGYCSRVGEGPFPTELFDEVGERIRDLGHEYGTTTKRPRRCGWLDLVRAKNAVHLNSISALCINHIDTIGKIGEEFGYINVCIAYELNDKKITYVPTENTNCKPIYKRFTGGWSTDGCTTYDELPENAKKYIEFIEDYTDIPVKYIGIGAKDTDTIIR